MTHFGEGTTKFLARFRAVQREMNQLLELAVEHREELTTTCTELAVPFSRIRIVLDAVESTLDSEPFEIEAARLLEADE